MNSSLWEKSNPFEVLVTNVEVGERSWLEPQWSQYISAYAHLREVTESRKIWLLNNVIITPVIVSSASN